MKTHAFHTPTRGELRRDREIERLRRRLERRSRRSTQRRGRRLGAVKANLAWMIRTFVHMLAVAAAGTALAFLALEWVIGCGEVTYFADGSWATNECVLLPSAEASGRWR